ncbi:hypothetical protein CDO52_13750 [Nocardiopsis gilva YIM 90087]|uniref:Uncharacterized protein n=1 Tax=Nocardiopsis gilva YIM 90087 TaxID=1235441 RepID=A0A223S6G0_9ACTN|nr:hypothetical protein [Nocardiopsis gilva]ASU83708.1 hypothetical protein CDO52_13750 [Nocardiopsis gilva YIM 90087]
MLVFVGLAVVTLVGALIVAVLVVRMLAEMRRLQAAMARTGDDLAPRYTALREAGERARAQGRVVHSSTARTIDDAGSAPKRG